MRSITVWLKTYFADGLIYSYEAALSAAVVIETIFPGPDPKSIKTIEVDIEGQRKISPETTENEDTKFRYSETPGASSQEKRRKKLKLQSQQRPTDYVHVRRREYAPRRIGPLIETEIKRRVGRREREASEVAIVRGFNCQQ